MSHQDRHSWFRTKVRRLNHKPSSQGVCYARRLHVEPLEDRRLLAALVGVDFDAGTSLPPNNWTKINHVNNFFTVNLLDESGVNSPYSITVTTNVGPGDRGVLEDFGGSPVGSTLPMHSQSLADLDGFAFVENVANASIIATFDSLDPNLHYEVYVFGYDGDGLSDTQDITIAGEGTPTVFSQAPSSYEVWVNGEKGDSSRTLESFAELVQPNTSGEIVITAEESSGAAVLGGLAIREVGILVNSTADNTTPGDGLTTLREAINTANSNAAASKILFDPDVFASLQIINLGSQLPTISTEVTIVGPGADLLTLDAGNGFDSNFDTGDGYRIFEIDDSTAGLIDVEISGLTISGGDIAGLGGAILSRENFILSNSALSGNAATLEGGGIYVPSGTTSIISSTISGNNADTGGGISSGGMLDILSSTLSNNSASSLGGGINLFSGVANVTQSTITGNSASAKGGGLYNLGATANVTGSIVAGNTAPVEANVSGTLSTNTFNLLSGDPMLEPLGNNGGPTETHALLPGSPAFDAGDPSILPNPTEFDQRGEPFARVFEQSFPSTPRIDIGAFELQSYGGITIEVDTTVDENDGNHGPGDLSLREAIVLANAASFSKITFAPSVFGSPKTINLGSQLPTITSNISIEGPGANLLTLNAGNGSDNTFATGDGYRIFNIDDSTADLIEVSLSGLTITGGDTPRGNGGIFMPKNGVSGGAILNRELLWITDSAITGNATGQGDNAIGTGNGRDGGDGGGIYNLGGTLVITRSSITDNQTGNGGYTILAAASSGGNGGDGGGIFNSGGEVFINSSTIAGNTTGNGGDAEDIVSAAGDGGRGGGLFSTGGEQTIIGSTFSGNTTGIGGTDKGGIGLGGDGGGIYSHTNAVDHSLNTEIIHSTISGNSTPSGRGGGLINASGETVIAQSTFSENIAPLGSGGGIYSTNSAIAQTEVRDSIIAGNTSDDVVGFDPSSFSSDGYNLIGSGSGAAAFTQTGDQVIGAASPGLDSLADNGGPTQTHALLIGSPAIDTGDPSITFNSSESDQRGLPFLRVYDAPFTAGSGVDIGAYERQTIVGFPFVVDTTSDENDGIYSPGDFSLREAIVLANASLNGFTTETITFDPVLFSTPQTIALDSQLPTIDEGVQIVGPGADLLTIDAQQNDRVFNVDDGTASNIFVEISGLTLTGGQAVHGGAIRSVENLTVKQSIISGNQTVGLSFGGGIFAGGTGALTVQDSTLSGNTSYSGGALINYASGGSVTIENSTLSGNNSNGYAGGAIFNQGPLTISSSTISKNIGNGGGGIFTRFGHSVDLSNTIVADNENVGGSPSNLGGTAPGTNTYNLIGPGATFGMVDGVAGNQVGVTNPLLGPLANNGGPTPTHALLPGSPALDAGDTPLIDDQRDLTRPVDLASIANAAGGDSSDIGAYEAQSAPSADFVDNDRIDGLDFLAWQRNFGTTTGATRIDGNADDDTDVDHSDYAAWETTFGQIETTPAIAAASSAAPAVTTAAIHSQSLSPTKAELIDAALAFEWLDQELLKEPTIAETFTPDEFAISRLVQSYELLPTVITVVDFDAIIQKFNNDTHTDKPWLAEELLEKVFG